MKPKLLASSPDLGGIRIMIARYWCTELGAINFSPEYKNKRIKVYNNMKLIDGFVVTIKDGRFRFEYIGGDK